MSSSITTANKITISRILLIPFFIFFCMRGTQAGSIAAAILFLLASFTDTLDGYIARKYNQITTFGKLMDPLADKILVVSALICLVEKGFVPGWAAIVIITREFLVTSLRVIAASDGTVLAAGAWGKLKTVSQIIFICLFLLSEIPFFGLIATYADTIMYISIAITVYSGVEYFYKNRKFINFS